MLRSLIPAFAIALMLGILVAVFYPSLASWWSVLAIIVSVIITELRGRIGFGSHWKEYQVTYYVTRTSLVFLAWMGLQIGSGNFGRFLVVIGSSLS